MKPSLPRNKTAFTSGDPVELLEMMADVILERLAVVLLAKSFLAAGWSLNLTARHLGVSPALLAGEHGLLARYFHLGVAGLRPRVIQPKRRSCSGFVVSLYKDLKCLGVIPPYSLIQTQPTYPRNAAEGA
jgi:hypothetical protein